MIQDLIDLQVTTFFIFVFNIFISKILMVLIPIMFFLKLCIFHHFLTLGLLQVPEVDHWVIPIIHGFVQVEELVVNYNDTSDEERSSPETPPQEITCVDDIHPRFTVALISRRSRHRPGKIFYEEGHT